MNIVVFRVFHHTDGLREKTIEAPSAVKRFVPQGAGKDSHHTDHGGFVTGIAKHADVQKDSRPRGAVPWWQQQRRERVQCPACWCLNCGREFGQVFFYLAERTHAHTNQPRLANVFVTAAVSWPNRWTRQHQAPCGIRPKRSMHCLSRDELPRYTGLEACLCRRKLADFCLGVAA